MTRRYFIHIFLFFLLFIFSLSVNAQNSYNVRGVVKDSVTNALLNSVTVAIQGDSHAALSNAKGYYQLSTKQRFAKVQFSCIGYEAKLITVDLSQKSNYEVLLVPQAIELQEVTTSYTKKKYVKKGNPAVELMKKVIEHKNDYRPIRHDYYQYEEYERKSLAVSDFKDGIKIKGFSFLNNYIDTSKIGEKPILWLTVREKVSDIYYRKKPETEKEIVKGVKRIGIDETFNQDGIDNFLGQVFSDINIFDNDITYLMNRFVSPLSFMATSFYKFYIVDTIQSGGKSVIDLEFVPFDTRGFGFTGHLYVMNDTTYAVKKIQFSIPRDINLNYVKDLFIEQEFEEQPNGTWMISRENMAVDFSLIPTLNGFYSEITKHYSDYMFDTPREEVYKLSSRTSVSPLAGEYSDLSWNEYRKKGIREKEAAMTDMMAELHKKKSFGILGRLVDVITTGYVPTALDEKNKIELGPYTTMISHNGVEGWRYRMGFRTTVNTDRHWYLAGYGAYGNKDHKFKYYGDLRYSFNKRKNYIDEFPMNNLKLTYKYDLEIPGQRNSIVSRDYFFLSFNRDDDEKMSYIKEGALSYQKEFTEDFMSEIQAVYRNSTPTGALQYFRKTDEGIVQVKDMTTSELLLKLRYSPGQKYYQNTGRRFIINRDAPIMNFKQTFGFKDFLGADYNVIATEFDVEKRFWFSAYGNLETYLGLGQVWNKAPFPLLFNPNTNTSYFIEPYTYAMMNVSEFINDRYASLFLIYHANGWLFNKIPLLKHLKFREVISFRGLLGGLSDKNNPEYNNDVFLFPTDTNGNTTSFKMNSTPYMEMSFGIENIFNIIRVDYLLRMSYLDNPGVSKHGWQIGVSFAF